MGSNSSKFEKGREPYDDRRLLILSNPIYNNDPPLKSFKTRMAKILIDVLCPSVYGLVILLNVDNVKGVILFIIAVLYGIAQLFFYIVRQNQNRRMRELDIQEKRDRIRITIINKQSP